jgi:general secretion pathway protein N
VRPRAIALTGAIAYAAFLVATVPASWLAARVAAESAGFVQLDDPHGTLWSGSARALIASAAGKIALDQVQWRFAPAELAAGRAAFDFTASGRGLDARARVGRGFSEWVAGPVAASLDASLLASAVPLLAAWRPEGRVKITGGNLGWNDAGRMNGAAHIGWEAAAVSLADVKPLGRYSLDATADHGPASVTVTTLEGPLRIAGKGTFSPPSRFTFSGEARGEGPDAAALEPLLNLFGPRRADGSRAIELRAP